MRGDLWSGAPPFLLITDPAYGDEGNLRGVEACIEALPRGSFAVQLRDKKRDLIQLRVFASRLRMLTKPHGAWLIINGNADLARDVGAEGVHLGGDAMTVAGARAICGDNAFITIAAHSDDAVKRGVEDGASAALVSAIFASPGKAMGRGVAAIRSARAQAPAGFGIYALGGVDRTNAASCIQNGANGIAVIRAILLAKDPVVEARAIYESLTTC